MIHAGRMAGIVRIGGMVVIRVRVAGIVGVSVVAKVQINANEDNL